MLGGGVAAKPGDVVEVSEAAAWNIISLKRGEEFVAPAEPAKAGTPNVDVREPVAETRDPAPKRGSRRE